jgi:hypothetical protein
MAGGDREAERPHDSVSGPGAIDTFAVGSGALSGLKGSYPTASLGPDAGLKLVPYGFGS